MTSNRATTLSTPIVDGDPYGRAALLLVESLIHVLREREVLSHDDALDIVRTALDVQVDQADAADGAGAPLRRAQGLLTAIEESLLRDGAGE